MVPVEVGRVGGISILAEEPQGEGRKRTNLDLLISRDRAPARKILKNPVTRHAGDNRHPVTYFGSS